MGDGKSLRKLGWREQVKVVFAGIIVLLMLPLMYLLMYLSEMGDRWKLSTGRK